jgi:hypothetical protein
MQHQRQHSATVVLRRLVGREVNATRRGHGAERSVVEISETWLGQHGLRPKYEPAARTEEGADQEVRSCLRASLTMLFERTMV